MDKKYLTTSEAAKLLGISRVAVFKKIKKGEKQAIKAGRNYLIYNEDTTGGNTGKNIEKSVNRVVREYGEAIKLLGDE